MNKVEGEGLPPPPEDWVPPPPTDIGGEEATENGMRTRMHKVRERANRSNLITIGMILALILGGANLVLLWDLRQDSEAKDQKLETTIEMNQESNDATHSNLVSVDGSLRAKDQDLQDRIDGLERYDLFILEGITCQVGSSFIFFGGPEIFSIVVTILNFGLETSPDATVTIAFSWGGGANEKVLTENIGSVQGRSLQYDTFNYEFETGGCDDVTWEISIAA